MLVDARRALARGGLVEITTTGRHTGRSRRVAIAAHNVDGRIYLSGRPGRRGWYANVLARPELTLHLRGSVEVDLPARARPVTDPAERRRILEPIARSWRIDPDVMVDGSPLVELMLDPLSAGESRPAAN
ncbi:MAG TPA: nitroreductase/quinone reductase family protein [Candidatus Limnocylindria bacterium]|nr:nitroreductase/quinone reductase family protein [Candidatus Limnocylindria bacterium]